MGDALTAEQQRELERFPPVLRDLVEAELRAGNSVVEIGPGHPAPPVGACVKLARRVTTRPRASGAGLDFRARSSSSHSGEFTDERRFHFVLEPPEPAPAEPDMDAIRRAYEPRPDPIVRLERIAAGACVPPVVHPPNRVFPSALVVTESAAGGTFSLRFRARQPPHEVRFALERELMTLFTAASTEAPSEWYAAANVNGTRYAFELDFEAALPRENRYALRADVSWAGRAETSREAERATAVSWMSLWTRELEPAEAPAAEMNSPARHHELCRAAQLAEAHLDTVARVQHAILEGLKRGGSYATSHKEGGSHLFWRPDPSRPAGWFVRADHGDDPRVETYEDEARFLDVLWRFCNHEVTSRAIDGRRSELDAWRLILRRLRLG